MRILVACEESQAVTKELRRLGHEAYSCDIIECSGGHPEWHICDDVLNILNPRIHHVGIFGWNGMFFKTCDGNLHGFNGKWDMIIAFPPCTYLTNAGTRHFSLKCNSADKVEKRKREREKAADFFMRFVNAECDMIAIENPVGYINTHYRKADQIIHPYYFAESEQDSLNYVKKRTCLWLKNLPKLERKTYLNPPEPLYFCNGEKCKGKPIGWVEGLSGVGGGNKERAKVRSKTFPGVAREMAEQWAGDAAKEQEATT